MRGVVSIISGGFWGVVKEKGLRFGIESVKVGCDILQTDGVLAICSEPWSVVFFVVGNHHFTVFINVIKASTIEAEIHKLLVSEENAT